ncbi:MAG TPA: acyltransferase family protein, partial [Phycisphaerae bacterium]|nr:acyltransferase family protein [Phycisphaerae bacterium]
MTTEVQSIPSQRESTPALAEAGGVGAGGAGGARRFYAFDCVRALAMLLGVFYHWQFVKGGFGLATGPKGSIDHWLHSFRMALFFLISGFFANMMLGKYGVMKYLGRRWWRIGMPLAVAIVGFAALSFAQDYFAAPAAAPGAPGNFGFGGGGGGGNPFGGGGGAAPFGGGAVPGANPFGGAPGGGPGGNPAGGGRGGAPGTGGFGGAPGVAPGGFGGAPAGGFGGAPGGFGGAPAGGFGGAPGGGFGGPGFGTGGPAPAPTANSPE